MTNRSSALRALVIVPALALLILQGSGGAQGPADGSFAARIASLSEAGGYFDTDNLISNEASYLHVMPDLERGRVRGGAYIGVGPDQNFSYIALIRPDIAFIVDVRRDNLLLHLLFKALFDLARTRVEYLSLLFARATPTDGVEAWRAKPIDEIAKYIETAPVPDGSALAAVRARVTATVRSFGVPLTAGDFETIDRFHRQFIDAGLGLRFRSTGRAPQYYYPTYGDLLAETDRQGNRGNFLASEDAFQFVKSLQAQHLVVPIVGNLSGPTALVSIGRLLRERQTRLSAFYASNVEFYLFREGTFTGFVDNLGRIPSDDRSVVIRSVFGGGAAAVPGYGSTSLTQPVADLLEGVARGRYRQYWELTAREPRAP